MRGPPSTPFCLRLGVEHGQCGDRRTSKSVCAPVLEIVRSGGVWHLVQTLRRDRNRCHRPVRCCGGEALDERREDGSKLLPLHYDFSQRAFPPWK